jgi:hypothetical protein
MWNSLTPKAQDNAINIATAMVGICLGLSPWLLGFADIWATWSAALLGSAIALMAIRSLLGEGDWEAFAKMALGLWAAISPALLSFTEATGAALAHLLSGGAAAALSAVSLRLRDNRQLFSMKRHSPRISTSELRRKAGRL